MADTPPERTYKHQVPADVFKNLFTPVISKAGIDELKLYGIEQLKGNILKKLLLEIDKVGTITKKIDNNYYYFFVFDAKILPTNKTDGWITIDSLLEFDKEILFLNCDIQNLAIHNSKVSKHFAESTLRHNARFVNSTINSFSLVNVEVGNVIFQNTKINSLTINGNTNLENIEITNKSNIGCFKIHNSSLSDLILNDSSINELKINGKGQNELGNIFISEECKIGSFEVEKYILKQFEAKQSYIDELNFDNVKIDRFDVENVNSSKGFSFFDTEFLNIFIVKRLFSSLTYTKCTIPYAKILLSHILFLKIDNGNKINLYVERTNIVWLKLLKASLGKDASISFTVCAIHHCLIQEFAVHGNLYFRSVLPHQNIYTFLKEIPEYLDTENLEEYFTILQSAFIDAISNHTNDLLNPTFKILHSSLGKTEFIECHLSGYTFIFNNSKINDIFVGGGTLPEVIVQEEHNFMGKLESLFQQKHFFDQLKKIFENQGDIVGGTRYHALASNVQMKILLRKGVIFEWLVYALNWLSNKHGESWFRGLLFTLFVSLVGFHFYNIALSSPKYSFVWEWNTDYLSDWAQFIIPTHKIDFIDTKDKIYLTNSAAVRDILSRIFIGYGIYQLISAFRKHGKRG
jgi:hypothetical protein